MLTNNTPRVGYVLKRYPRYSETFIVNEILAHEAAGLEVEIFSLLPPKDSHFQDVIAQVKATVNYLPSSASLKAINFWTLMKQAGETLPDLWRHIRTAADENSRDVYLAIMLAEQARQKGITHFHAHFASMATTVARLASLFSGIPFTFTAHAKDIFHKSVQPATLRQKLADAATVITVSDYNESYLTSQFGQAALRVRRIYNGMDLQRFPYKAPQDRPPVITYVGRLVEKKGIEYLIDACSCLARGGLRFECQIVGSGELEVQLRSQVEELELQNEVKLLGPRPQKQIAKLIQSSAVFAAPCVVGRDGNRDGLPTVLLEAMALGTPCVSTDVTGIPEVVRNGVTGLMVRQRDSKELAAALERFITDSELRVTLAARARSLIESTFEVHRNTAQLRSIFSGLPVPQSMPRVEVVQ